VGLTMQTQVGTNTSQVKTRQGGLYRRFFKRPMDFILALLALIVLSPVFLVVAVLVRFKLGSPVIFKQKRPGLNEKIFTMYKFRTMTDERDVNGELLPDSVRLTKFGRWLRSTSLDELPELFNILKGDMSIVGPRPLAVQYLPYYSNQEKHRHDVRPGLTGLAQINGRNSSNWEERFSYDLAYIRKISFTTDIRIIALTALKVFKREGVSVRGTGSIMDFDKYRRSQKNDNR
jgi:undecaprenyl phosphate N,N'-diacetylbacillosamine 1-phosphate transferase